MLILGTIEFYFFTPSTWGKNKKSINPEFDPFFDIIPLIIQVIMNNLNLVKLNMKLISKILLTFISFKKSKLDNIFHINNVKAGSQWIKQILGDKIVFPYTGLLSFTYQNYLKGRYDPRKLNQRYFDRPFPKKTIVTPLYLSYQCYQSIPKPPKYKAIYIYRDPRDLLISYYFSIKYSHELTGNIKREALNGLNLENGILKSIELMEDFGFWDSSRSWCKINDPMVLQIRYENLIGKRSSEYFKTIFKSASGHIYV